MILVCPLSINDGHTVGLDLTQNGVGFGSGQLKIFLRLRPSEERLKKHKFRGEG